jgi:hypothetical protein
MDDSIFSEIMDLKSAHKIRIYLNEKYGAVSDDDDDDDDDEPKEEAHEDVEHDHISVIVEGCSTSWSSDGDNDDATTRSLDKLNDDITSDAIDDSTPCTLDGDDGSCSGHDSDATTSPSTTPHCFMSQGDTKVSKAILVDHVDSYDELVSRLASITIVNGG